MSPLLIAKLARSCWAALLTVSFTLLVPTLAHSAGKGAKGMPTMVQVHCHNQNPDFQNPWQMKGVSTYRQLGIFIAKNRILTILKGCEFAALIEVSLLGRPKRFKATQVNGSGAYDLLELSVDEKLLAALAQPPTIAKLASSFKGSKQSYSCFYRQRRYDTKAIGCKVRDIAISPRAFIKEPVVLAKAYSSGMVPIAIGSPVTSGDRLAGLVYSVGPAPSQLDFIPSTAIQRFRERKSLWGLSTGMVYRIDLSPEERAHYGLPGHDGILVSDVTKGGLFDGVLKPGDQLLKVDGHSIDTEGYIFDKDLGRVPYDHLSLGLAGKDSITIQFRRGAKKRTVTLGEKRGGAEVVRGERPQYGILSGLVVQQLSLSLLRSVWGEKFGAKAPEYLVSPFADTVWGAGGKRPSELVISSVLPDASNIGYRMLKWQPLSHINGVRVRTLAELYDEVQKSVAHSSAIVLTLSQPQRSIVLSTADWQSMRQRLKLHNRLPDHAVLF